MTDASTEPDDVDDDLTPLDASQTLIHPAFADTAAQAVTMPAFQLRGGAVDAYFIRRSDTLLVTFDNLSSVGVAQPPQPWLQMRAAHAGMSVLGIIASQKDWYRNADTPALICALRDAGLFAGFKRVVFTGASMGGFAAVTYSALVPGSVVLAFSPQSTLNRKIVPFEKRYNYASRKWDWQTPEHLDAAKSIPLAAEVWLVFDPFVAEDRAHARRLEGPNVRQIHCGHMGHRAIRQLKTLGVLSQLIDGIAQNTFDALAFFKAYRARRTNLLWQRSLVTQSDHRGHGLLLHGGALVMAKLDDTARFPPRLAVRLAGQPEVAAGLARRAGGAPAPAEAPTIAPPIAVTPQLKDLPPLPEGSPFAHAVEVLENALVLPEREDDTKLASGVLAQDGSYCVLSKAWIRAGKATPAPSMQQGEKVVDLAGTHLFGGHFRGHFGHFLVESTARLWALGYLEKPVDSILYLPYRGAVGAIERAMQGHEDFYRLLGITAPVQTFGTVLRVERLIVPELGFGWSERYAGSPAYRAFMQTRLSRAVAAEGGEKLYISRAKLPAQRGGILGETVIEENLARAGFEIFYPEKHPVAVQLARYKAAKHIVALDGSALHLAAYVLAPDAKVTMILRRSKANVADYDLQFRSFCGITPSVVDVIKRDWIAEDATRVDFRSVGELDFKSLFARLKSLGALPKTFKAEFPNQAAVDAMLETFGARRKSEFRVLQPGERLYDEAD